MGKSKCYLINPYNKTITESYISNYKEINEHIGDTFTIGPRFENGDTIFLDDNGLLKEGMEYFSYDGYGQPFAGVGVVLGTDGEGESVDVKHSIDFYKTHIHWLEYEPTKELIDAGTFRPVFESFDNIDDLFNRLNNGQ